MKKNLKHFLLINIFIVSIINITFASPYKLYELQKGFDHWTFMTGIIKFFYGDLVFEDNDNYYLLSEKRNRLISDLFNGDKYINTTAIIPKNDERVSNYIKYIKDVEINQETDFDFNNPEVKQYLKSEEKYNKYEESLANTQLTFFVSENIVPVCWGRAQSFIGKYSSMKLQIATDYVVQTYNPAKNDVAFGYYVTKTPVINGVEISVQCNAGNSSSSEVANRNARIFSHYIQSGELIDPELIKR